MKRQSAPVYAAIATELGLLLEVLTAMYGSNASKARCPEQCGTFQILRSGGMAALFWVADLGNIPTDRSLCTCYTHRSLGRSRTR
jgi:hypothetical protein